MHQPPFLPQTLQDWAQVVSAIATALAVIVSLYIAFRGERARVTVRLGRHINLMLGAGAAIQTHGLNIVIVNIGTLPVSVSNAQLSVKAGELRSGFGLAKFDPTSNKIDLPVELTHGRMWSSVFEIHMDGQPWNRLTGFLQFLTLRVDVFTTTGRRYRARLGFLSSYRLWRDLSAAAMPVLERTDSQG